MKKLFIVLITILCLLPVQTVWAAKEITNPAPGRASVNPGTTTTPITVKILNPNIKLIIEERMTKITIPEVKSDLTGLQTYNDPYKQLSFNENVINIVFEDPEGDGALKIDAIFQQIDPKAIETDVNGIDVYLRSRFLEADFSSYDNEVGVASAYFDVEVISLLEGVSVKTNLYKGTPNERVSYSLRKAARVENKYIIDVASVMTVDKTGFVENGTLAKNVSSLDVATVTMSVNRAWMEEHAEDQIAIMHYGDNGEGEILYTLFRGLSGDIATYRAVSPRGLSSFALVALIEKQPVNWSAIGGTIGGTTTVVGTTLLFFFFPWRRRSKKLPKLWPTGLSTEDWLRHSNKTDGPWETGTEHEHWNDYTH
ncbi:MAG: hypothetical protein NTV30_11245 [Chloroflexi bacterium]|nr:hypothetical protein [Chloroflexota bacterium]